MSKRKTLEFGGTVKFKTKLEFSPLQCNPPPLSPTPKKKKIERKKEKIKIPTKTSTLLSVTLNIVK